MPQVTRGGRLLQRQAFSAHNALDSRAALVLAVSLVGTMARCLGRSLPVYVAAKYRLANGISHTAFAIGRHAQLKKGSSWKIGRAISNSC